MADIWLEARPPGRTIAWTVPRVVASIAVVLDLYYLLPFDRASTGIVVTLLVAVVLGLAIKIVVGAIGRGRQRRRDADGGQPTRQIRS